MHHVQLQIEQFCKEIQFLNLFNFKNQPTFYSEKD